MVPQVVSHLEWPGVMSSGGKVVLLHVKPHEPRGELGDKGSDEGSAEAEVTPQGGPRAESDDESHDADAAPESVSVQIVQHVSICIPFLESARLGRVRLKCACCRYLPAGGM